MALPPRTTTRQAFGFAIWRQAAVAMDDFHSHADVEVNHLHQGALDCLVGGRVVHLEAGDLLAFWAAIPHRVLGFAPGSGGVWATLPMTDVGPGLEVPLLAGACLMQRRLEPARTQAWPADLAAGANRARAARMELEALLLRLAPEAQAAPRAVRGDGPSQVGAMAACMASRLTEPLTVTDIAEAADLHPRYAQAVFRAITGTTIWDYLLRLRVAHAQALLRSGTGDLLAIALEAGFGSPGRFHAAFRRIVGTSPARWRRASLG